MSDITEANLKKYDEKGAKEYNENTYFQETVKIIAQQILNAHPETWNEKHTKVLDFACGPGFLSRNLAPHAEKIVGVDISPNMVSVYNQTMSEHGIPENEMHAVAGDLINDETLLKDEEFDVAVCSLAFHHIPDIVGATKGMVRNLKKGGRIYVVDFEADEKSMHASDEKAAELGVAHRHGINKETMESAFKESGLGSIESDTFKTKIWATEQIYKNFVAGLDEETEAALQIEKTYDEKRGINVYGLRKLLGLWSAEKL